MCPSPTCSRPSRSNRAASSGGGTETKIPGPRRRNSAASAQSWAIFAASRGSSASSTSIASSRQRHARPRGTAAGTRRPSARASRRARRAWRRAGAPRREARRLLGSELRPRHCRGAQQVGERLAAERAVLAARWASSAWCASGSANSSSRSARGRLDPRDQARVRLAPLAAGQRLVRDVAGEDVLEDDLALVRQRRGRAAGARGRGPRGRRGRPPPVDRSSPRSAATAPGQKTRPTTAAACGTRFASAGSRSIRAARTAWTVSGTARSTAASVAFQPPFARTIAPSSTRLRTISSRKNGLPSARATRSARSRSGRASTPIRKPTSRSASPAASGSSATPVTLRRPPPHVGRRSVSSGRAVQRRISAPRAALDEVLEQVEQGPVGPVDVLDDDGDGRLPRQAREERAPGRVRLRLNLGRIELGEAMRRILQPDRVGERGRRPTAPRRRRARAAARGGADPPTRPRRRRCRARPRGP